MEGIICEQNPRSKEVGMWRVDEAQGWRLGSTCEHRLPCLPLRVSRATERSSSHLAWPAHSVIATAFAEKH
jgi:hypothetical protein